MRGFTSIGSAILEDLMNKHSVCCCLVALVCSALVQLVLAMAFEQIEGRAVVCSNLRRSIAANTESNAACLLAVRICELGHRYTGRSKEVEIAK